MFADTAWAWCSARWSRRTRQFWRDGWLRLATLSNVPHARAKNLRDRLFLLRLENGAVERTRTSTVLLPPAPQAGASASSATTAFHRLGDYSSEPRELRGSHAPSLGD